MPPIGPRRVRSWVYEVINPLLAALPGPLKALRRHDWTWAFHRNEMQWVTPIIEYVPPDQVPTFEDFQESSPEVLSAFVSWDGDVHGLDQAVRTEYEAILADSAFQAEYSICRKDYQEKQIKPEDPWGAWSEERGPCVVAEHIVNSEEVLDSQNYSSTFWRMYRDRLLASLSPHVAEKHRLTLAAGDRLLKTGEGLVQVLKNQRTGLCRNYDIPFAPPSSTE